MEIKKNVILRKVAGDYMLVPIGAAVFDYNGIFMLTESARLLWEGIKSGEERDGLIKALLSEYDIDEATAAADVDEFLSHLEKYGII